MGNIISYLKWRGDLTFSERGFNEVDNAILSALAYVRFDNLVPGINTYQSVGLAEVYQKLDVLHSKQPISTIASEEASIRELLQLLVQTKRFQHLRFSHFVTIYDEERVTQFAAVHIELDEWTTYIAFRGTDDTIVGWQEDFMMSFQITAAQRKAVDYLEETIKPARNYFLGGHSKGGNLAVYGAMNVSNKTRYRILTIFDNDGPGLSRDIIAKSKYPSIEKKLVRIVPEFSIVGMLFYEDAPKRIVASSQKGLVQHRIFTWQVEKDAFVKKQTLLPEAQQYQAAINGLLENTSIYERKALVRKLFRALQSNGAKYLTDLSGNGLNSLNVILQSLETGEGRSKIVIRNLLKTKFYELRSMQLVDFLRNKQVLLNIITGVIGILFILIPSIAVQLIGSFLWLIIFLFSLVKSVEYIRGMINNQSRITTQTKVYIFVGLFMALLLFKQSALILSTNFLLGGTFIAYGFHCLDQLVYQEKWWRRKRYKTIEPAIYFLLGSVALITSDQILVMYIVVAGVFIVISSSVNLMRSGK